MLSTQNIFRSLALLAALPLSALAANVPPTSVSTIPDATLYKDASAEVIDLSTIFADPDSTGVRLTTVLGTIDVALFDQATPLTVANFFNYVDSGRYLITDPTTGNPAPIFFHRSVPGFVIQTGGFLDTSLPTDPATILPTAVVPFAPVPNEPGISNIRGTVAMAKIAGAADSATSQFYINLADNSATLDIDNGGYTVFGRVLGDGMAVADAIAALPVFDFGGDFTATPLRNYTQADFDTGTPAAPANAITIPSITRITPLTFTASSDHSDLVSVAISGNNLLVTAKALGTAMITATGTDSEGATVSQTFQVTVVANPPHLANISTRVVVGTNQDALIGGFIVLGTGPKRVGVRALGPSLASVNLTNVLADPTLELHDGAGNVLAVNDNWQDAPNEQEIIDAGLAPSKPNESVILTTLPGSTTGLVYTAVVRGASGGGGNGLVEVYDLASGPGSIIANISTRGNVQSGDNIMIGGFLVFGDGSQRVLVRALGPSLGDQGITDPLEDPTLTLVTGDGTQIDFNDDWQNSPDVAEIQASTVAPTNAKEAAVIDTLPAGAYTAIVRGAGSSTGTGLVEAYALPPK
ncbi:MAG: peptidylprolyl isomerase [Chthoniobacterales bacterium]|nr:peptidylprolyl isomerase [Chthoniobacterales bacterium]